MMARLAAVPGALAAALLAVAATGCDSDRRAIDRDDVVGVDDEPAVVVALTGDGFDPASVVVQAGDLVEFANRADAPRGVRDEAGELLDSGLLEPGESTFVVPDRPGRHRLVGVPDASRTALLEVRSSDEAP